MTARSNSRDDAPKLKWDGVRCLIEDAQSDILLLLDACSVRDPPISGSHGMKQAIAACSPGSPAKEAGSKSFTLNLVDSLHRLGSPGSPFTIQKLYEDMVIQKRRELSQAAAVVNGITEPQLAAQFPVFFTLTPGAVRNLSISALAEAPALQTAPESMTPETHDQAIDTKSVMDLKFGEDRVLVCTTFLGDASAELANFKEWLRTTPPLASRISVEGMFLGPNTTLLISMPPEVYDLLQGNEICLFLGQISSHNMLHLYDKLMGPANARRQSDNPDLEHGKILLEARNAASVTPNMARHEVDKDEEFATAAEAAEAAEAVSTAGKALQNAVAGAAYSAMERKHEVVEDVAMKYAAEQLNALKHVRHLSDETPVPGTLTPAANPPRKTLPDDTPSRHDESAIQDANESGADDSMVTPTARNKRRSLAPKSETRTRCIHCSHGPFKDSSSLRKHVAAAHTRPFPCAFSFAGCTSTFGSKNEWKRHIASQHLCLTYYRCSQCHKKTPEGRDEFNRKDLFTQHLRRMHAPLSIKKAVSKDSKLLMDWENHVKDMQQSCLIQRRHPPHKSACPKPDCNTAFEGRASWDEWTEHVGRHMEKGEGQGLGVDGLLAQWALEEGIIEQKEDGEFKLVEHANGMGGAANGGGGSSAEALKAWNRSAIGGGGGEASGQAADDVEDDHDPRIADLAPAEKMDVDE